MGNHYDEIFDIEDGSSVKVKDCLFDDIQSLVFNVHHLSDLHVSGS